MSEVRFFRFAAALPIAIPLVAYGLLAFSSALPAGVVSWLLVLAASLWIGGIPYALFALMTLWLLRERPPSTYRLIALLAPTMFAALFVVGQFIVWIYFGASGPINREFLIFPAWCLILGYAYLAVVFIGLRILRRFGAVDDARAVV